MTMRRRLARLVNRGLEPFNLRVERLRPVLWDRSFAKWIQAAEDKNVDPNDIGDREWFTDSLERGLEEHYLPLVGKSTVVLELGPGSGRLTRHVIGQCEQMILVDASPAVCRWLRRYLEGKGNFRVVQTSLDDLSPIGGGEVDVALAHGVVEHLEQETLLSCLWELRRVLAPGGVFAFNFDDLSNEESLKWLARYRDQRPDHRFRFHHPESVRSLALAAGFSSVEISPTGSRVSFAVAHL